MKADEELMHRYLNGLVTAAEVATLNERLRESAEARAEFAELMNLDSALAAQAAGWQFAPTARRFAHAAMIKWLALAACLMLAAGVAWWQHQHSVFAVVHKGVGVEDLAAGLALHGEEHEIKTGTVELITARGARVVIEAPATFHFESAQRLRLARGRVAAEVPPAAKGFTVMTPTGDAVDLGTKFGVDVTAEGAAEIHVFQGEVVAHPNGTKQRQSLRGGEALTLQSTPGGEREFRSGAFIRSDELPALSAGFAAGQRAKAEAALSVLRRDPALITLMDFETAELPKGQFRMVQGRWPGSHAAEFVHEGDHMKLDVGGGHEWPRLTLAAWVRLDRLGAPYQSLYHTDGWDGDKPGQLHWMINKDTTMRLALKNNSMPPPGPANRNPDSLTPVLPEQGRWVHLAVVYDSDAQTVRFYLNGAFDSEAKQQKAFPARLGPAQIGNWNKQDRKLSGRIDELVILGRVMTDNEVRDLHAAGTPYR